MPDPGKQNSAGHLAADDRCRKAALISIEGRDPSHVTPQRRVRAAGEAESRLDRLIVITSRAEPGAPRGEPSRPHGAQDSDAGLRRGCISLADERCASPQCRGTANSSLRRKYGAPNDAPSEFATRRTEVT